jgi:hypothetical protein
VFLLLQEAKLLRRPLKDPDYEKLVERQRKLDMEAADVFNSERLASPKTEYLGSSSAGANKSIHLTGTSGGGSGRMGYISPGKQSRLKGSHGVTDLRKVFGKPDKEKHGNPVGSPIGRECNGEIE